MRSQQSGFTLIELIAVIVVLGILAATALPKFVDLSTAAEDAAVKSVAGSITSGMSLNYANAAAAAAGLSVSVSATAVHNCSDGSSLVTGGLPTGYTITAAAVTPATLGSPKTDCVLTYSGKTANFTAIYVP